MTENSLNINLSVNNPFENHCVVMVIETSDYLHRIEGNQFNLFTQKLRNGLYNKFKKFNGTIITHNDNSYLVLFEFATDAILCALKIHSSFKYITPKFDTSIRQLKIGVSTTSNRQLNSAIELAINMCEVLKNQIAITTSTKQLFKKENKHARIDKNLIRTLKPAEEKFLSDFIKVLNKQWGNADFSSGTISDYLSYSNSQIYRKVTSLTGKSPTLFIRDYRLNKALKLTHQKKLNITTTALQSGFKSPTYFTKCFKEKFNILPTKYIQQHT